MMREAADRHGLLVISEVMDQTQIAADAATMSIFCRSARATCRTSIC